METRPLGNTGLQVSEVSLGAWQFGGTSYGPVSEADAHGAVRAYLERGGNFIDTARRYGDSEKTLGDYFAQNGGRDAVVLASKSPALAPAAIRTDLENTLRLLRTDRVDLYYLHNPPEDPGAMREALDAFGQLKAEGKIRFVGASVKGPNVTPATADLCRRYIQTGRVNALMIIYSLFRRSNSAVFAEARAAGVGIVARTVLENGFLSGKYAPGHEFTDHRARWKGEKLRRILGAVQDLQNRAVAPPYAAISEVAIRFALDSEAVSSVVIGARAPEQIVASVKAADLPPLPGEVRSILSARAEAGGSEFNIEDPAP